jgi:hypothetical protein
LFGSKYQKLPVNCRALDKEKEGMETRAKSFRPGNNFPGYALPKPIASHYTAFRKTTTKYTYNIASYSGLEKRTFFLLAAGGTLWTGQNFTEL